QQAIKQELYLFLLKKREESAISKSSTIANARIIDRPKADTGPFKPKKTMIMLVGFVAGFLLPFAISYGKDFMNTTVHSQKDITSLTKTPILADIGHNETDDTLVITKDTRNIVSEQFRSLRTNLQYLLPGINETTILITSSMS